MKGLTTTDKMIADIDICKEILSTMPKNNEKNKKKRIEYIDEAKEKYISCKKEIIEILQKRYDEQLNIEINPEINNLNARLKTIEDVLYLLNEEQTSYEKMGLDKNIYKLEKFYKENFDNINEQIAQSIEKFEKVGIKLNKEDFDYDNYVSEYMNTFFEEHKKQNKNSDTLKAKFEEIYWKCPDIIILIELNFRHIYMEKKNSIDKFFEKSKNEILKKWDKSSADIKKTYTNLLQQKMEKEQFDKKTLLDKFIKGKLNIKNYTEDKFMKNVGKILSKNAFEQLKTDSEITENINKFLNSLYEYRSYMKFKFVIEDVKKYYNNKEQYKKSCAEIKKKIENEEKKLTKSNRNSSRFFIFKSKKENNTNNSTKLIKDIEDLYKQLDLNTFYEKVAIEISENSTLQEVLSLAVEYYNYMISCMIKNEEDISQDEMDLEIEELKDFLNNPYNTIINNISFLEEKDIVLIIKDRYKLLNFTIEKEDLDIDNLDSLISIVEDIKMNINLHHANIEIKDIEKLQKIQKILNTK